MNGKIVAFATVAFATKQKGEMKMPSLMRKINIISRSEGLYRADKLKSDDLCSCHHSYVLAICHNPGMSQEKLAKHICINKSGVTRQLSYLEEKGYVERRADKNDKRVICVYPTEKMLKILPKVEEIVREWNEFIAEGLSENEIEVFSKVLEKIADKAQNYAAKRDEI